MNNVKGLCDNIRHILINAKRDKTTNKNITREILRHYNDTFTGHIIYEDDMCDILINTIVYTNKCDDEITVFCNNSRPSIMDIVHDTLNGYINKLDLLHFSLDGKPYIGIVECDEYLSKNSLYFRKYNQDNYELEFSNISRSLMDYISYNINKWNIGIEVYVNNKDNTYTYRRRLKINVRDNIDNIKVIELTTGNIKNLDRYNYNSDLSCGALICGNKAKEALSQELHIHEWFMCFKDTEYAENLAKAGNKIINEIMTFDVGCGGIIIMEETFNTLPYYIKDIIIDDIIEPEYMLKNFSSMIKFYANIVMGYCKDIIPQFYTLSKYLMEVHYKVIGDYGIILKYGDSIEQNTNTIISICNILNIGYKNIIDTYSNTLSYLDSASEYIYNALNSRGE